MQKVKEGDNVKVHYTGTLNDGSIFDSNENKAPLEFKVGEGQVIAGFENAVKGMELNEEKTVMIPSQDAYGPKQKQLIWEIPKDKLPSEINPEAGAQLMLQSKNGQQLPAVVSEVKEKSIVLDLNHPMAEKDLTFKIRIIEIN